MCGTGPLIVVVLALGVSACGEAGGEAPGITAAIDTVSGIQRLSYPESGAPELSWRLDSAAVIGGYGVDSEQYQFDQVGPGSLAGDAGGELFVVDGTGKRVLGYDAAGAFIGSWGREGSGPGELQMPTGLGVGAADTLWVLDSSNRRITLLPRDPEAEPSSVRFPEGSTMMGGRIVPAASGVYGVFAMFSFRPGDDTGPPPRPLVRMGRDGVAEDTVWTAPAPVFDRIEVVSGGNVMVMMAQQSFAPQFHWDRFSDGAFALADGAEYDVRLVGATGQELFRIRREPAARATTEADREFERNRLREASVQGNFPGAEQMMEKRLEQLTFAVVVPRLTGLVIDTEDRLWVGVSVERPGETDRIDVYDRDGSLLGEIQQPEFFPNLFYGDGLAARLTEDELEVQQIVVYSLETEAEAG
jgi:hypothetical protein